METVTQVKARDDLHLEITFGNGETRLFDARPYLKIGAFQVLQAPELFRQAYIAYDTVCWPGELDISPDTLYAKSKDISH